VCGREKVDVVEKVKKAFALLMRKARVLQMRKERVTAFA